MSKQKFNSVVVRGVSIDGAAVGRLHTSINNAASNLDTAIEANIKQWLQYDNADWLRELLNSELLLGKSGKLKKLGREVAAYVMHYTFVQVSDKSGSVDCNLTKNKKNKRMLKLESVDEDGARIKVEVADDVDLPMSFSGWQAANDGDKKPEASNKKASTLASQLDKMAGWLSGESENIEVLGDFEDVAAIVAAAQRLGEVAAVEASKRKASADDLNLDAVEQLEGVIGGHEKRAM